MSKTVALQAPADGSTAAAAFRVQLEAARDAFGEIGLKVLLISAVISTVPCINGGLFGDNFFHSVIDCAGLESDAVDPGLSLCR